MRYWWVSHNKTHKYEMEGGYLWSPKTRQNGVRSQFYDNMMEVRPGDIVFSFSDTFIKAVGVATTVAKTTDRPAEFGSAGSIWATSGWYVTVQFTKIRTPFRPKDHIEQIGPLLPGKYSPLKKDGNGHEHVYLAEVSEALASCLTQLISSEERAATDLALGAIHRSLETEAAETQLLQRTDLPATAKLQLVMARRGMGRFRSELERIERGCRLTGISVTRHLRASHIKPWKDSSDDEKLDGCNGLLLAPHVDHLFDGGYISFEDTGDLLISAYLKSDILDAWGISRSANVGGFIKRQMEYLAWHRQNVFERPALR